MAELILLRGEKTTEISRPHGFVSVSLGFITRDSWMARNLQRPIKDFTGDRILRDVSRLSMRILRTERFTRQVASFENLSVKTILC